jgi:hypothetical protein
MAPKIVFSEAQLQDIKRRRDNGESQKDIGRDYGCSCNIISRQLKDGRKVRGKIAPQDHEVIKRRRAGGERLTSIAKSYGVCWGYISDLCSGKLMGSKPSPLRKVTVQCLKCDRKFKTRLAGSVPEKRLCPKCTEVNKMFCGALI